MAVTASDGAYSGNVVYVWYVNGSYVGAGSQATPSLTFGANLAPGAYRLDVTALSADGLRAGAATAVFTVN
jgi:hypothetical protein